MHRKEFITSLGVLSVLPVMGKLTEQTSQFVTPKKIGIIGIDTSHAFAFTKAINTKSHFAYTNFVVSVAYPYGNPEISNNKQKLETNLEKLKEHAVVIVNSIAELLAQVDYVLLLTNDGNLHLQQAIEVIKAKKPLFIDKPIANSYKDAKAIFDLAAEYAVPVFSSSSLRYVEGIDLVDKDDVLGIDGFTPAPIEPSHKDLYWYGIHGVEMIFALMGDDCKSVKVVEGKHCDIIIGKWDMERLVTLRAERKHDMEFGGFIHYKSGKNEAIGKFKDYEPLLLQIVKFFSTEVSPVPTSETLAICKFIDAAHLSKKKNGKEVWIK